MQSTKVRACVVLGREAERDLSAMAIATGQSKSALVERGIRLVHSSLAERTQDAVERVRDVVDARSEPPPPSSPEAA